MGLEVVLGHPEGLLDPGRPVAGADHDVGGHRCAAAGLTFDEVVKLTFYLTDLAHLRVVRAVRDGFIDTARPAASTAVQVVALARPELLLEVEAFALVSRS
jgi:enamine deaminase RidA (YjgF/YER057c/UK114 family)